MYYYTPGQIVVQEEGKKKPGNNSPALVLFKLADGVFSMAPKIVAAPVT